MSTIVEKIISSIPNCSQITDDDKPLYDEFLKSEGKKYPYHYSRSWVFIKQISQGLGVKYFDKKKEHLITIAPNWGGTIPNYIFLPLGINAVQSVPFLAQELSKVLEQEIFVKKVYGDENKEYLLKNGFQEVPSSGNTDFKKLDDDKYPEVVCSVDDIIKATFGFTPSVKMDSFKNHIRKIKKKIFFGEYEVLEKNLTKELQESFYDLVERWSSNIAERTAKQFESGADVKEIKKWMSDVYYPHFIDEYAGKVDNKNIIAYLTFLNNKSVAFTSAYPINQNCLAVNASFCDIGYEGLIQYQFFSLAARAKLLGYKYLNLGSNDIESQYLYKSTMGEIAKVYPYILKFAAQKN
ncbi:MAG: hypothetical protein A3A94_03745 [Candidatus Portnoybacteria bacterium RIFCSPLOWO2_01_FULL_43_11]|uniref:BioF2-like acetyltransferase domain-containing protein n=3 Tax=Candidatus Portnoyibacteriota TaxID=1817913 RepID=A0A1G2FRC5_9BACT|nr:MAG: hypothetical protein A3D38_02225 [Candidatus Portnoybacteria bacterium RIFCSPHIGHO2_02_FULL_40_23]OGZ38042.1 MAG: hypothetical protein A3E90_00960 [Candidatus Portnoybacteria bacterium RIFCSPHIGHO2_12_FULL_40_11]OGZ38615.1 MAG: hypothetical protein A3A94_03745 [Candidatus Portnoybacteria bacterium RIFCSPLOWO2_01_FULL_43_11]OGZ40625.1 MAG: hypothetical protein A3I20_00785 [Candidatus Portnoybacteria bacterium RIFCSPLOWO2_02_FULL_40_15]